MWNVDTSLCFPNQPQEETEAFYNLVPCGTQQWSTEFQSDGSYHMISKATNQCLAYIYSQRGDTQATIGITDCLKPESDTLLKFRFLPLPLSPGVLQIATAEPPPNPQPGETLYCVGLYRESPLPNKIFAEPCGSNPESDWMIKK